MLNITKTEDEIFNSILEDSPVITKKFYKTNPRAEYYKKLLVKYATHKAEFSDIIGISGFCLENLFFRIKIKVESITQ